MKRIVCILAFISLCSFTVEDPLMALLKKLEEFTKKYPAEKAYLHLDKPYYAAGDDIWFKAYVTDWKTGQLSDMSNILYVELINQDNKVEKKLRLPMQNGLSWGDFKLTDTLAEGNYRVRAYTQWMRNGGPDFFFDKTIKIGSSWNNKVFTKTQFTDIGKDSTRAVISFTDQKGNPITGKAIEFSLATQKGRDKTNENGQIGLNFPKAKGNITINLHTKDAGKVQKIIPIKIPDAPIDIQFLPEGGKLVQGIKSKVAIKAIGSNGLGLKTKGTIVDQEGQEFANFETSELGMGSFYFVPDRNKTYTAKLSKGDGFTHSVGLPLAETSGYTVAFTHIDSTKFKATVRVSPDLLKKGDLNLVAQKNGSSYSSTKISPSAKTIEVIYEKQYLPQGIVQFTLFSPENMPVCERLIFIDNKANDIDIILRRLKPSYEKKEKANLSLVSMLNSQPVMASFSIAVTNMDAVTPDYEQESNIKANLLLTSDLVGYVEKPNSYFLNNDAETKEALDLLMLTQGWRKIDWRMEEPVIKHEVEKELKISGVITKSDIPLPKSKVSLITNIDGLFMLNTESNRKGEFIFNDLEFTDSTKFIIQARTEKDKKDVQIAVNLELPQEVTPIANYQDVEVNINESINHYLEKSAPYFEEQNKRGILSKTILLKEVNITAERINLAPNSKNLNGPGNADQVIDLRGLYPGVNLADFLRARVAGVVIDRSGIAISRKTWAKLGYAKGAGKEATPAPFGMRIILDGQDMGRGEPGGFMLSDVSSEMVESIEVITSLAKAAVYGPNAQAGLFIITTKTGADKWPVVKYAPGVTTYTPKGYYPARTFYSPKYDVDQTNKPDLRTTVFWSPNLVTDEFGSARFEYFNTDQPGNYRMVIEGIDINGNIARKTYTYTVN